MHSLCVQSSVAQDDKQSVPQHPCGLNPPALLFYWHRVSALHRPLACCPHSALQCVSYLVGRRLTVTVTDISLEV